jgi:hypothetical protein
LQRRSNMAKQNYTTKLHARRLLQMLNKKDPCGWCPASRGFVSTSPPALMWSDSSEPCLVCRGFVGLIGGSPFDTNYCPCHFLGHAEAIKRTWIVLEEGGYLK